MPKPSFRHLTGPAPVLFPLLLLAIPALAAPPGTASAPVTAAPAVTLAAPTHAGYPTTREKWRYCPRDGSHQCVDLDIPGVTVPDPGSSVSADAAWTAQ